jgi:heat shock protein HslJ
VRWTRSSKTSSSQSWESALFENTEGGVSGSAGCNNFFGSYEVNGTDIAIGPLNSTRKACGGPAGVMEQEQQFLSALETASTFQFVGERLGLRTETGALAVSLSPQG